jgi:hypothetical protein
MGDHMERVPVDDHVRHRRSARPRATLRLAVAARSTGTRCCGILALQTGMTAHHRVVQAFGERGAPGT